MSPNSFLSFHKLIRIGIVCLIFSLFGAMFVPFLSPILMAALFGFALEPIVAKYELKKSTRRAPAALIILAFYVLIASPIALLGYRLTTTVIGLSKDGFTQAPLFQALKAVLTKSNVILERSLSGMHISAEEFSSPATFLAKAGSWMMEQLVDMAGRTPEIALDLFIFSAALYVFLTETSWIKRSISELKILSENELKTIIQIVQKNSYTTLIASASIGAIQALTVALGALIFGYSEFLLLFVITFFASFIPVIGAAPVALLLAVLSIIQGQWFEFGGLLVVSIIGGSVDNLLKPYIVSASSEESLNPVISLLAIIGAVMVYGLPGILLGPLLMELALKIIPILFPTEES